MNFSMKWRHLCNQHLEREKKHYQNPRHPQGPPCSLKPTPRRMALLTPNTGDQFCIFLKLYKNGIIGDSLFGIWLLTVSIMFVRVIDVAYDNSLLFFILHSTPLCGCNTINFSAPLPIGGNSAVTNSVTLKSLEHVLSIHVSISRSGIASWQTS